MAETIRIDMSPVLRRIDSLENRMDTSISDLQTGVGQIQTDLSTTSAELRELKAAFDEYVMAAQRTANVQRSETKVGALKAELDRQFGHYSVVRRSSIGLLQAFDIGNVTNEIASAVSEELMIESPRYWLAPALVALAAWSRDDKEIADKSVDAAFNRSPEKTSLFFALVLRRQDREDASIKWLRHYFSALDPTALTREFAVILEAASQDGFGPAGAAMCLEMLTRWNSELRSRPDVVDAQIQKWVEEIGVHRGRVDVNHYSALAFVSPQWPAVQAQLESAAAIPAMIDDYTRVRDFDAPRSTIIEDLLDDLLEQLVTEYDDEELPLRREVAFHEAVIDESGDLQRADKRAAVQLEALEETIDAVSLQTMSAISPDALGVSQRTQRVAVGAGQEDFRSATGRFTMDYRSRAVTSVPLHLGPKHSSYAENLGFVGWDGDSSEPEESAVRRLDTAWDTTVQTRIDELALTNSAYIVPSLIAAGVVVVVSVISILAGLFALVIGAATVYFLVEQKRKRADAAIAEVEAARDKAKQNSRDLLRRATAEFVDATLVYEELDSAEPDLLRLINTWPTAANSNHAVTA
ncbi:hypothetical protein CEY15_08445 [Dietzia natronolimnaea]|uniref:Uncharacterized protein n=1 Tax=Dietzia natronolimnaea TaxID=161920 RepID=A0A2A2WQ73_9ACTN|nr:hypothetical protein [Dietzia natronolimnaea]PAY23340.1 hypothetical protein CEY15_08445 [Dietzia natronolimnaea]